MSEKTTSEICCPKFNPAPWQDKEITWTDKAFAVGHVTSAFHMPLNFGSVITRLTKAADAAGALAANEPVLSDEKSAWKSDLLLPLTKEVAGLESEKLSGTFLARAYEGGYKDIPSWIEDTRKNAAAKGRQIEKLYFWYTTCPKCARKWGKNYVVIFAKV